MQLNATCLICECGMSHILMRRITLVNASGRSQRVRMRVQCCNVVQCGAVCCSQRVLQSACVAVSVCCSQRVLQSECVAVSV